MKGGENIMNNDKTFYKGYKYRIHPTEEQKELIDIFINGYRFIYNWGIAKQEEAYELYKQGILISNFYSFFDLCKLFKEYRDQPGNEWLKQIPNTTSRLALRDVIESYNMFFKGYNKHPNFKTKKRSPKMFKTRNDRCFFTESGLRIEGLPGRKELIPMPFDCGLRKGDHIIQPVISIDKLGNYWVSFTMKEKCKSLDKPKTEPIGIDLGIRQTMTLSTGEVFNRPNEKLVKLSRRISRLDHHCSRDIKRRQTEAVRTKTKYDDIPKSKRSIKREHVRQKLINKQKNIKKNFYYEVVNEIVHRNPSCIVIETIPVQDTAKNKPYMAKQMVQADFYWISLIIKNKANAYNIPLIQAHRNFPSSQICSNCGHIRNIQNRKIYICPECGFRIDRDLNAAINLKNLAICS